MKDNIEMFKKVVLCILICVVFVIGVYFSYFHRPPSQDILAANLQEGDDVTADDDGDVSDVRKTAMRAWDAWVRENKHVSIGKLYNTCNETSRISVGRVIMMLDEVNGGVTSQTFVNLTLDRDVTDGWMYLTCSYNGNTLYSNHWKLCTVEEGMPDRIIFCPIRAGRRKFVKQLKIPNYLPKGQYTTKAWLLNQDGDEIGCAFAAFSI